MCFLAVCTLKSANSPLNIDVEHKKILDLTAYQILWCEFTQGNNSIRIEALAPSGSGLWNYFWTQVGSTPTNFRLRRYNFQVVEDVDVTRAHDWAASVQASVYKGERFYFELLKVFLLVIYAKSTLCRHQSFKKAVHRAEPVQWTG